MLSIITPFYNTSPALFEPLFSSIKAQSDNNFEWIIINDCSNEAHTTYISQKVADSTLPCKLYHNTKNIGAALSRNNGLKLVTGDYVVFVDSDDYIAPDFVQVINDETNKSGADVLLFDYARNCQGKITQHSTVIGTSEGNLSINHTLLHMTSNVCGKVIKVDTLKQHRIFFPNTRRFEDWAFMSTSISCASSIYYVKKTLYTYVDHAASVVHVHNENSAQYAFDSFRFIKENSNMPIDILECIYIREVLYSAIKDAARSKKRKELMGFMEKFENEFPNWKKNTHIKEFSRTAKIILTLYRCGLYGTLGIICRLR